MLSRVVRFAEIGGPEVLRIVSEEPGVPGAGEVLVRIEAIGLNRAEVAFRAGQYFEPPAFPARIGCEAAGAVLAVGSCVTHLTAGDAVSVLPGFAMSQYGVYGDWAVVPATAVIARPAGMDAVTGAALWMAYLTAYGAIVDLAKIGPGDAVVITAASSSVGIAAIQICNMLGAVSIALTRDPHKATALRQFGAAHVVVGTAEVAVEAVARATGERGARLVFDPVAGPSALALADMLGTGGLMVLYGNLSGQATETPFPFMAAVGKGLAVRGYLVFELIGNPAKRDAAIRFVADGVADGRLMPVIARTFDLDDIAAAHRYLESNQQIGKIVVTTGLAYRHD